jgi:Ca2+-binding EF-hand superfamily protein
MSPKFDEESVKDLLPENFDKTCEDAFKKADINKDGAIDVKELHAIMKEIAKEFNYQQDVELEDARQALDELDVNKNGKIEFEEFKKLFVGLYIIREMSK